MNRVHVGVNLAIGITIMMAGLVMAVVAYFWQPPTDAATVWPTTTTTRLVATSTTSTVPTTTVAPTTTSTVMPVPEHDATQVDHNPIVAAARVFLVGWLAPTTAEERRAWLEPVTTPRLLPVVAGIPVEVLPKGQAGDITIVYADIYRAVAHVTVDGVTAEMTLVPGTVSPTVPEAGGWRVNLLDKV